MKRRNFIKLAGTSTLAVSGLGLNSSCSTTDLKVGEIMHSVIFDLKHPVGSPEALQFMEDGKRILKSILGVHNFQAYRQCSPKNQYQYGFFMTFQNQADFDTYSNHPDHNQFVKERWEIEVVRFQESDFMQL